MANGKDGEAGKAPYLPFATFKSFIGGFSADSIPPRIDRSLMKSLSGSDQSAVLTALRFFGLVEASKNDAVTERFRNLVKANAAGPDQWKATLKPIFESSYQTIVDGLDKTATPAQLDERFRDYGQVNGSVLDKAVRLYLSLAEETGVELSPLFKKRSPTASSPRRPSGRTRRPVREDDTSDQRDEPRQGVRTLKFSVPSGDVEVILPEKITAKEVSKLGDYIKDYFEMMGGEQP